MPVLMVGDLPINLIAVQPSGAALTVMNSSGQKFWAAAVLGECPHSLVVKTATGTYTIGNETLVAQVSGIGTCETITLTPGCYRAEVKGGSGGSGGGTNAGAGAEAISKSYSFSVNQNTDIMAFVGGNGNAGSVNTSGVLVSGGGGGSSGMPSVFLLGETSVTSDGGVGGIGGSGVDANGAAQNCGGGGGAPSGAGGAAPTSSGLLSAEAGISGSYESGGKGGTAKNSFASGVGGAGGENLSATCGTVTVWSYGGGGGGGINAKGWLGIGSTSVKGGNGGSGVSDTSDGYVKIYRIG